MLKWVFGADTGPFRTALHNMRSETAAFSGSVKGQLAGLFGGAALLAGAAKIISHFARIKDLADRFGESAESIQKVGYAATQSGTDIEGVAKALTKVTANAVDAARNGGEMAESFARLGINASTFANLPLEEKLLALSAGYDASKNSGEGLADIIKVVGKSGGEMIPLLVQGAAALQAQMDAAKLAGEGVVGVMASLDDRIEDMKTTFMTAFASIIAGFTAVTATAVLAIGGIFDAIANGFDVSEIEKAKGAIASLWKDVFDPEKKATVKGPDVEGIKEAAEAAKKIEDDRKKLIEDIAKLEEDARIKSLSLAEKILDAEKRRAELAADALFGADETAALEARKAQLEVEKEISGYRKEQADNDEATQEKRDEAAKEIQSLTEKGAEIDRANKLAGMSDKDKKDFLTSERDQALKNAEEKTASGDTKGGLEESNRAKGLTGEINDLARSMNDELKSKSDAALKQNPTIATSSLADIGGGGGARVMVSREDLIKKSNDYLAQIVTNTSGGDEGARPPEPV